jgi:hypothetical protein
LGREKREQKGESPPGNPGERKGGYRDGKGISNSPLFPGKEIKSSYLSNYLR